MEPPYKATEREMENFRIGYNKKNLLGSRRGTSITQFIVVKKVLKCIAAQHLSTYVYLSQHLYLSALLN